MTDWKEGEGPGSFTKVSHVGTVQAIKTGDVIAGRAMCLTRGIDGSMLAWPEQPVATAQGVWEESGTRLGAGMAEGEQEVGQASLKAEEL